MMQKKLDYNGELKGFARGLREEGTKGEAILWKVVLKASKTGYAFNRQYIIGDYIVDFICRQLSLIIEIDGNSHNRTKNSDDDEEKQRFLEAKGYTLIRFSEKDVVHHLDDIAGEIQDIIYSLDKD